MSIEYKGAPPCIRDKLYRDTVIQGTSHIEVLLYKVPEGTPVLNPSLLASRFRSDVLVAILVIDY